MSSVRRAKVDDAGLIAPLFAAYRVFYGQPDDAGTAEGFLRARLQRDQSVVLFAEQEERVAGFVQMYPLFSSVRLGRIWILNDLFVIAQARRHGIARSLLQAATDFARDDGALRLELETTSDNVEARALYRTLRWQLASELRFHLELRDA